jgi:hypothetical protein
MALDFLQDRHRRIGVVIDRQPKYCATASRSADRSAEVRGINADRLWIALETVENGRKRVGSA